MDEKHEKKKKTNKIARNNGKLLKKKHIEISESNVSFSEVLAGI